MSTAATCRHLGASSHGQAASSMTRSPFLVPSVMRTSHGSPPSSDTVAASDWAIRIPREPAQRGVGGQHLAAGEGDAANDTQDFTRVDHGEKQNRSSSHRFTFGTSSTNPVARDECARWPGIWLVFDVMNSTPALDPLPRIIEIASLADFDRHAAGALASTDQRLGSSMHGWHVQSVDLRARGAVLEKMRSAGSVFMGCEIEGKIERRLRGGGALVFPEIPGLPFDPYRGELYSGPELYAGLDAGAYESVPDARIYAWASHRLGAGAHDSLNAALVFHTARPRDRLAASIADPRRRTCPRTAGRGHGRTRPAARVQGLRERRPAGERPVRGRVHRGHRRRTRGHGGGKPGGLPWLRRLRGAGPSPGHAGGRTGVRHRR